MASALQKAQTHDDRVHGSRKVKVTILGSEWGPSNGGLSTINRELAIQLAKCPEVEITFFLPKCSQEDIKVALDHKVEIVEATPMPGFEKLDWLCFPPKDLQIDIIVGHGVKLGKQAQVIKDLKTCKWFQVVHTDPEELGMFKNFSNPISEGEEKHKTEVELCKMADHVVGVGPKLSDAFRSYLRGCKKGDHVLDFTPGVLEEFEAVNQDPSERQQRSVLVFGRGDVDDFELKGFDIAGKAIAALQDTRLMFVGASDGKHEEIAKRLIDCGVPASRLRVRGFARQDRESLKRLFQEVDLAVMPSRTEGFGLTGLEAMSAGLPVLVSRNSGFGEALRSTAFGSSFVIDSEDPAVWTVAIQNILSKDRECRLEEAVTLRDSYGRKYNWTKQIKELVDRMINLTHATEDSRNTRSSFETKCNASQRMESMTEDHEGTSSEDSGTFFKKHMPSNIAGHEGASSLGQEPLNSWSMQSISGSTSSIEADSLKATSSLETKSQAFQRTERMTADHKDDRKRRTNFPVNEQLLSETSFGSNCEKKADAASGNQTRTVKVKVSQSKNSRKRKKSKSSCDSDIVTRHCYQDLSDEQEKIIHETLTRQIQVYTKYRRVSTPGGVSALIEHIQDAYNLALKSVGVGSLEITFQCTSLESLECLWSDYQSGHLNDIAERYLVTDDIKKKLNLESIRLKTIIEEENYRICKRILMEKLFSSDFSPSTQSDQEAALLAADTSSDVSKNKKQALAHMERAEKAKASRGPLHKDAISGQYETVKMLLESGVDVNLKDQFSLTPLHLACWYGQESVVRLLLERGANVNAKDRFQRTPLQKAERQNHHSIVQLLLKNDARPSLHQPVSLRKLARKGFLQVDKQSGFNLLQAAVLDGKYKIVLNAHGLLDNIVEDMELVTTGNNAKQFPGKTAVDILSLIKRRTLSHHRIERLYNEWTKDNSRLTELQWATCHDHVEQAVEFVLNDGVDINAPGTNSDWTALLRASRSSSSQFIQTLIDLGADVNAQRKERKETPLILTADWNNYMAAYLLVRHGADVNVQISNGFTALHLSVQKNHENLIKLLLANKVDVNIQDNAGWTPLHLCVRDGNENLCRLLLEHNADVNIQDNAGWTPLHWCARVGNENLCRLLLDHNADFNIHDNAGWTPLHWCARVGNENVCRLLLEHNADVNIQDKDGSTLLHLSARGNRDCSKIIDLLVKYGVQNINIHDAEGLTPLQLAVRHGNWQVVEKLVDLGADVSVVIADEEDARRLEILKNKAESEKQRLKFEMRFRQKTTETENEPGVSSVPSTGN